MRITIFGSGYVGLVTGACLADVGHAVTCVDIDAKRVAALTAGIAPIYEPGIEDLLRRNLDEGRLAFTDDAGAATRSAELIYIAVGTPQAESGAADVGGVLSVAESIGAHVEEPVVVAIKSTVPVGTSARVRAAIEAAIAARGKTIAVEVCSNPEFLKEGSAIEDFTRAARIVVGTGSARVRELMRVCYGPYNRNHDKILFMDAASAELTKYAANAMLATKISFMNELANIAERVGADIEQVRRGIGSDPRIGYHFIYAGCGYGGSCFPKDIRALAHIAGERDYAPTLLAAVHAVNEQQKRVMFAKLADAFGGALGGRRIAVWGLAFKPDTDDMREAPSRALIDAILEAGGTVSAYDPKAMEEAGRIYAGRDGFALAAGKEDALEGADALAICTEWREFRILNLGRVKALLKRPLIVDGRNLFDPAALAEQGFDYRPIGRAIP